MRIVATTNLVLSSNCRKFVILISYYIFAFFCRYLRQIDKIYLIVMRF